MILVACLFVRFVAISVFTSFSMPLCLARDTGVKRALKGLVLGGRSAAELVRQVVVAR